MTTILHDWDMDRYERTRDALKRAISLCKYAASRKTKLITPPKWVYEEKMLAAFAIAKLDKLLGINTVWGLTENVMRRYPLLKSKLEEMEIDVRLHDHINPGGTHAIPVWFPPLSGAESIDKLYDSHWPQSIPEGWAVWHIDYFNSNRAWLNYIEFLAGLLK